MFKKYFERIITYSDFIVIPIVLFIYYLIISTLDQGTSCDEGWYLMGYLNNQTPIIWVSDFATIIKTLFGFIPDEHMVNSLRWIRFILGTTGIILLVISILKWHHCYLNNPLSLIILVSVALLSGAISFAFGVPTLYYDNIQLIIYLLVISFLFISLDYPYWVFTIINFAVGILLFFGVINYLASGILLLIMILFLTALLSKRFLPVKYTAIIAGLFSGAIIYHFLFADLYDTFLKSYHQIIFLQTGMEVEYGSFHQLIRIFKSLLILVGQIIVFLFLFIIIKQRPLKKLYLETILLIIMGALMVSFNKYLLFNYMAYLLFVPVAYAYSKLIYQKCRKNERFFSQPYFWITTVFLFVPLIGIWGTDQDLEAKMLVFTPFWGCAYILLFTTLNKKDNKINNSLLTVLFVVIYFAGYIYLGQLRRPQNYYSVRSSQYLLEKGARYQNTRLSFFQKEYYENAVTALQKNGFQPGDEILTFYENFLTVYIAGGYVPGPLIYSFEMFLKSPMNKEISEPEFIIIASYQEEQLEHFSRQKNWGFPKSYKRIELGRSAENLPYPEYNSILFINNTAQQK